MNGRTATIIVVTAIPIIVVAYLMLDFHLSKKIIEEQCGNDEICVRYCCEHEINCEETAEEEFKIESCVAEKFNDTVRIIKGNTCKEVFIADINVTTFLKVRKSKQI